MGLTSNAVEVLVRRRFDTGHRQMATGVKFIGSHHLTIATTSVHLGRRVFDGTSRRKTLKTLKRRQGLVERRADILFY